MLGQGRRRATKPLIGEKKFQPTAVPHRNDPRWPTHRLIRQFEREKHALGRTSRCHQDRVGSSYERLRSPRCGRPGIRSIGIGEGDNWHRTCGQRTLPRMEERARSLMCRRFPLLWRLRRRSYLPIAFSCEMSHISITSIEFLSNDLTTHNNRPSWQIWIVHPPPPRVRVSSFKTTGK